MAGQGPGCAICGKPVAEAFRPFCSKRCADVDLNRWLTGRYAVPADENDEALPDAEAESEGDAGQGGRGRL